MEKRPDRRRLFSTPEVQALVIHGRDDPAFKVKCGRLVAQRLRSGLLRRLPAPPERTAILTL
jgi:hypothetical protein